MNVSAVIVTRGDVDLQPVLDSLPPDWEQVIWDNGAGVVEVGGSEAMRTTRALPDYAWEDGERYSPEQRVPDLSVYGRYAAIEWASHDLIYVQDDDCIVSDPQAIVDALVPLLPEIGWVGSPPGEAFLSTLQPPVVCNMPPEFRHDFYVDHALVGFGAAFHRDAPNRAFGKLPELLAGEKIAWFHRTCDIVFTGLTPRVLVDVPVESLPYAHGEDRMWRQPTHQGERAAMLDLVRKAQRGEVP